MATKKNGGKVQTAGANPEPEAQSLGAAAPSSGVPCERCPPPRSDLHHLLVGRLIDHGKGAVDCFRCGRGTFSSETILLFPGTAREAPFPRRANGTMVAVLCSDCQDSASRVLGHWLALAIRAAEAK